MEHTRIKVIGRLDKKLYHLFIDGLDLKNLQSNQVILFCDYSSFDIPVNYLFTKILDAQKGESVFDCQITLKSVSQQLLKPFDSIPLGWKTVCKFEVVNDRIPHVINDLPEVKGWTSFDRYLFFI